MLGSTCSSAGVLRQRAPSKRLSTSGIHLTPRPHLALRGPLQVVASAKQHRQPHQPDRGDFEQLDPQHGHHQRQQQQDPRRQGPPRWRAWLGSLPKLLPLFRRPAEGEETAADGKAWSWKVVLAQLRMLVLGCLAAGMLLLVRYTALLQARTAPKEVLYSDFVTLLDTGRVKAARLEAASSRLFFECHTPSPAAAAPAATPTAGSGKAAGSSKAATSSSSSSSAAAGEAVAVVTPAAAKPSLRRRFYIKLADKQDPLLVGRIIAAGVEYAVVRASFQQQLQQMLLTVLALWIPLLPLLFLAQRLVDSRSGSRRSKTPSANTPKVTFADVAGVSSAKEELREVVACLKNAAQYSKVRARMPSGVLLSGPPGTGKTLLAKAVAGEAGVPFIAVAASEFVELFVGRGAARVRELFAEARKCSPCVVFIDEIDALGGKRGMGFNDERDQTLNQLLTELDGFNGRPGVMLLAATNRVDVLDPALLRPGRISRRVVVPLPDEAGRAAILGVHLRQVDLEGGEGAKTEVARQLARITPGFSGAELANIVNEALLLVARRNAELVSLTDLLEGISRTRYGVNGGSGGLGSQTALGKRLGKWLLEATQPRNSKLVKAATS